MCVVDQDLRMCCSKIQGECIQENRHYAICDHIVVTSVDFVILDCIMLSPSTSVLSTFLFHLIVPTDLLVEAVQ